MDMDRDQLINNQHKFVKGMSAAIGYKRSNPQAGKKAVSGGLGSKRLYQKPSPPGPSQALAQSTPASAGLALCITPLPNSQDANMNPRQLKRKVRDMEAQALTLTDNVIELEVALKKKNETINKHLKHIRLLNEKHSEDRKACNLVSSIKDYQSTDLSTHILTCTLLFAMRIGFVFRIAGT